MLKAEVVAYSKTRSNDPFCTTDAIIYQFKIAALCMRRLHFARNCVTQLFRSNIAIESANIYDCNIFANMIDYTAGIYRNWAHMLKHSSFMVLWTNLKFMLVNDTEWTGLAVLGSGVFEWIDIIIWQVISDILT